MITDFVAGQDRLDLSALHFTGLGNGHHGTLAVQLSADGSRTYLKSLDADAHGERFELSLTGNHANLSSADITFAEPTSSVALELLGVAHSVVS